jgi:hypothetical protein
MCNDRRQTVVYVHTLRTSVIISLLSKIRIIPDFFVAETGGAAMQNACCGCEMPD